MSVPQLRPDEVLLGPQALKRPGDLQHQNLIHADISSHPSGEEWNTWLAAAGMAAMSDGSGLHFHEPALAFAAWVRQGAVGFLDGDAAENKPPIK